MFERYDYDIYEYQHHDEYNVVKVYVGTGNSVVDALSLIAFFGLAGALVAFLVTAFLHERRVEAARAECAKQWHCSLSELEVSP